MNSVKGFQFFVGLEEFLRFFQFFLGFGQEGSVFVFIISLVFFRVCFFYLQIIVLVFVLGLRMRTFFVFLLFCFSIIFFSGRVLLLFFNVVQLLLMEMLVIRFFSGFFRVLGISVRDFRFMVLNFLRFDYLGSI